MLYLTPSVLKVITDVRNMLSSGLCDAAISSGGILLPKPYKQSAPVLCSFQLLPHHLNTRD